jgi:hypothetical protein
MLRWLLLLSLLLPAAAGAHPMSRDQWSLRHAVKLDGGGLTAVVVLEIPDQIVVEELKAAEQLAKLKVEAGQDPRTPSELRRALVQEQRKEQWKLLAEGCSLTVNGSKVDVPFTPHDTPANGRAMAGFFLYIVSVELGPEHKLLQGQDEVVAVIQDDAYPTPPMVFSALVKDGDGWATTYDSSAAVFGEDRGSGLPDDPRSWSEDQSLRRLEARWKRGAPAAPSKE